MCFHLVRFGLRSSSGVRPRPSQSLRSLTEMSSFRTKVALINKNLNCIHLRAALFHATAVLERARRNNHWQQKSNYYARRCRKINGKQTLLRNVNDYAEFLFQRWKDEDEGGGDDPSSDGYPSWFRRQYSRQGVQKGSKSGHRYNSWQTKFVRSDDEDDVDVEHIFRGAFGGHRFFYQSFKENLHRQSSSYRYANFNNWSDEDEEEFKFSRKNKESKSHSAALDFRFERETLGLSASDPLTLDVVKKAFQECAKKWHPDRHPSSSKVKAEEQFKMCNAAYESLRKVAMV